MDANKTIELAALFQQGWQRIANWVKMQPAFQMLFIFDNYNAIIDTAIATDVATMASQQFRVQVLSGGSEVLSHKHSTGEPHSGDPTVFIEPFFEALTEAEWKTWITKLPARFHSGLEQIVQLTGRIPLYLRFFVRCKAPDIDSALKEFLDDTSIGGVAIMVHLKAFANKVFYESPNKWKTFMEHRQFLYFFALIFI